MYGLSELKATLPPPDKPWSPATSEDWMEYGAAFGIRLPEDFIQYQRQYGEGFFVSKSHRLSAGIGIYGALRTGYRYDRSSFRYQVPTRLVSLRELKEKKSKDFPALYFEPGGLLPWGHTTNGSDLCWIVQGASSDKWRTAIFNASKRALETFDASAIQLIARVISGDICSPLLPNNFPGRLGVEFKQPIRSAQEVMG